MNKNTFNANFLNKKTLMINNSFFHSLKILIQRLFTIKIFEILNKFFSIFISFSFLQRIVFGIKQIKFKFCSHMMIVFTQPS